MPTIRTETILALPPEACFDLARDIGLHCSSAGPSGERAIAGVTSGLIGPNDFVTFEGRHFGVRLRHTSRITQFDRPKSFVDEMERGAFKSMRHRHEFTPRGEGAMMTDTLEWVSPLGFLGAIADALFLRCHLHKFLAERNRFLAQRSGTA